MPFAGWLMPENLSKLPQCSCVSVMNAAYKICSLVTRIVLSFRQHWTFLNGIKTFSISTLPLWKQESGWRHSWWSWPKLAEEASHSIKHSVITAGWKEEDGLWGEYWWLRHGPVTSVFQKMTGHLPASGISEWIPYWIPSVFLWQWASDWVGSYWIYGANPPQFPSNSRKEMDNVKFARSKCSHQ